MSKNIATGDLESKPFSAEWARLSTPPELMGAMHRHVASSTVMMAASHRHQEWEFNLVTHGRAAYIVEGRRVPIEIDSLLWLLPSQGHILIDRSPDFRMWVVVVRQKLIRQFAQDEPFARWRSWLRSKTAPPPLHRLVGEGHTRELGRLCERLFESQRDEPTPHTLSPRHHTAALGYLTAEAWSAYCNAPDRPLGSHLHPAVQQAVNWLAEHAHEPEADDLDALAERCHVSRPHLSRLFKDQTGQTLTDFRNRQRADRFAALLGRGGRLTATQAAYAAGFGSYAQAFRVVKQLTGQSPKALAKPQRSQAVTP